MRNKVLISSEGEVEGRFPQIPLFDICLLTGRNLEDVKRDYKDIQDFYDYSIVELMQDNAMVEQFYYKKCEIMSFESALVYNIYFDSDKLEVFPDSDCLPITLAALILVLSPKCMLDLAKTETEVYKDDYGKYFIKTANFLKFYERILKERGIEANINLSQKKDSVSVLIERQLIQ